MNYNLMNFFGKCAVVLAVMLALPMTLTAQIKVTRLAHGLSVGADIDYADEMTLFKAVQGRTEM